MTASEKRAAVEAHAGRTLESEFYYYAKAGLAFVHSDESQTNTNTGDTSTMAATNPADSGVTAVFDLTKATPTATTMARVYDDFDTGPPAGDAAGIENVLMDTAGGAPDAGDVTTATDVTYATSATPHVSETVGGGRGANAIGGDTNVPVLALEPGRQIVFETEKLQSDGDAVPMTLRWFEVPAVYSETEAEPPVHGVM